GAREHPLQFLAVDLVIDKDLAADLPRRHIDETAAISRRPFARHRPLLGVWLNYAPRRRDVTMPRSRSAIGAPPPTAPPGSGSNSSTPPSPTANNRPPLISLLNTRK